MDNTKPLKKSMVVNVIEMCNELEIVHYYRNLHEKNRKILIKKENVNNNNLTMNKSYFELAEGRYCENHIYFNLELLTWIMSLEKHLLTTFPLIVCRKEESTLFTDIGSINVTKPKPLK